MRFFEKAIAAPLGALIFGLALYRKRQRKARRMQQAQKEKEAAQQTASPEPSASPAPDTKQTGS